MITHCYSNVSTAGSGVGGLVGWNYGTISNCHADMLTEGSGAGGLVGINYHTVTCSYATGPVIGSTNIGGLTGMNYGTITECYAEGTVSGSSYSLFVGGFVGTNSGTITACYSNGAVCGSGPIGGLAGKNESGMIMSCYATGSVGSVSGSFSSTVGGLVGRNISGTIMLCYATGAINRSLFDYSVGGLLGINSSGAITSCFWDTQTTEQNGSSGGKGLTTEQMKTLSIYQNANWADHGWVMNDGVDYPRLGWEDIGGTPIPPAIIPFVGSGTEIDPYLISSAHEFSMLSWYPEVLDKHIKLTGNLDLSNTILYPIGDLGSFKGVFDGNGYKISNAEINLPLCAYVGLFSDIGSGSVIKNMGVENVVIVGNDFVGGLVGQNSGGSITACCVTGSVNGSYAVGGLVGYNLSGTIISCYAVDSVSGSSNIGGLVGSNDGKMKFSYAIGEVNGYSVGGLVGYSSSGTITSCFWDTQITGQNGSSGGKGLTTEQMKTLSIYQNANWADHGWVMNDGVDYPRLSWEKIDGLPIPHPKQIPLAGSGTADDPYLVNTAEDFVLLSWYSEILGKHIKQIADLDLSGFKIYPIGDLGSYSGVFNGDGHTISNVVIGDPNSDYVGLFSNVNSLGHIQNLGVENVVIVGRDYVGGLVGFNSGAITSCYVAGTVSGFADYVGGLVGYNNSGIITSSYTSSYINSSSPYASNYYGGLTGMNSGKITSCYAIGPMNCSNKYVGGLVGFNTACITYCYATGTVNGKSYVGGLTGYNSSGTIIHSHATGDVIGSSPNESYYIGGLVGTNSGEIASCYATGSVNCSTYEHVGGLVGENSISCTITSCYATGGISGKSNVGGLVGKNRGAITFCYTAGTVTGESYIGGLVGYNYPDSGEIVSSYATGNVSGYSRVGGLVGANGRIVTQCHATGLVSGFSESSYIGGLVGSSSGTMTYCYSTGAVSGGNYVGGLAGSVSPGMIRACFWDKQTSGKSEGVGNGSPSNITGKYTLQMKMISTFTDAGWDFIGETGNGVLDYWRMCVDDVDYPRLSWEFGRGGDFACPDGVGVEDLEALAMTWLTTEGQAGYSGACDANGDGRIDMGDFEVLAEGWMGN
ncbi:MAG TPA: GLUG motif-containing protein [Anaerohalosphaeraceae bacterium]|nr:GLUG motif-containing protein [Anaerohalosphaeraceae bacterium]